MSARAFVALAALVACTADEARVPAPPRATPAELAPAPPQVPQVPPAPPAGARREAVAELVLDADAWAVSLPPLPARVVTVHVRPGDRVVAGALVATVVVPEAALAAARAAGANERLALARERLAAVEGLLAQGLARAPDRAELLGRISELAAERALALATLRAAGLHDLQGLVASGGRVTLRAPIAGVVTEVGAAIGDVRGPDDAPVARVLGGSARRVAARWAASQPPPTVAELVLAGGQRRQLTLSGSAPAPGGLRVAWYDLAGPPLEPTATARVVAGAAP